jgi:hypothetical protein
MILILLHSVPCYVFPHDTLRMLRHHGNGYRWADFSAPFDGAQWNTGVLYSRETVVAIPINHCAYL